MCIDITRRRELIFVYDVTDSNPDGDPDNGDRPRIDHNGYNLVTDHRLKQTIREYWLQHYRGQQGMDIWLKHNGTSDNKSTQFSNRQITDRHAIDKIVEKNDEIEVRKWLLDEIPNIFIDIRFFGGIIMMDDITISLTGPVQFSLGRSLNIPKLVTLSNNPNSSSQGDTEQRTSDEINIVNYSLICFGGVISATTARDTELFEDDLPYLWEGLWYGTKNLNTPTKFNHNPRLLISVVFKETQFQIGGLYRLLHLDSDDIVSVQDQSDSLVDITELVHRLDEFRTQIDRIELFEDSLISYSYEGISAPSLYNLLKEEEFSVQKLSL